MMKKFALALLASCVLFSSFSVMAQEEETEKTPIYWEDVLAMDGVQSIIDQGEFKTFDEIDLTFWLPNGLYEEELTEQDIEDGFIKYYMTEDKQGFVGVTVVQLEAEDTQDYIDYISEVDGVEDIDYGVINGMEFVTYNMPANDSSIAGTVLNGGYVAEFIYGPMSDEGFTTIASLSKASIQIVDEGAEDEAEVEADDAAEDVTAA